VACGAICIHGVSKRFGSVQAVEDAHLCVERGELVALLGPSGCGKTTLLRLVAGFEQPDAGEVRLADRIVANADAWVPPEQRRVGLVFQDYALFSHLTVAENVAFGLPRRGRGARVAELLELTGLTPLARRYPHELSGGQQQRVAVARALAPRPDVVLLDEPWSNIDPILRAAMRDELSAILRAAQATVLLVTHDREEAFSIADRVALMSDGSIAQAGTPEEIYRTPASRWTASFSGPGNFVPGELRDGLVETLLGRFPAANTANGGDGRVEALIRPEVLELEIDPAGAAEVVGREFRGHDVLYRVRLNGTTLVSQRPSTETVPLGARVTVKPHRTPVSVFADSL
jgi:iron(III) transport system ATP-binding protein